jgi:nonspecific dipeptidase
MLNRNEGMADLIHVMNSLLDNKGKILIPGIMEDIPPVTPEEEQTYRDIDFDVSVYRTDLGCKKLLHNEDKVIIIIGL